MDRLLNITAGHPAWQQGLEPQPIEIATRNLLRAEKALEAPQIKYGVIDNRERIESLLHMATTLRLLQLRPLADTLRDAAHMEGMSFVVRTPQEMGASNITDYRYVALVDQEVPGHDITQRHPALFWSHGGKDYVRARSGFSKDFEKGLLSMLDEMSIHPLPGREKRIAECVVEMLKNLEWRIGECYFVTGAHRLKELARLRPARAINYDL